MTQENERNPGGTLISGASSLLCLGAPYWLVLLVLRGRGTMESQDTLASAEQVGLLLPS